MSNYTRLTENPATGEMEEADWLDGYFGPRIFGVRFKDGDIYDERTQRWIFEEKIQPDSKSSAVRNVTQILEK